LTTPLLGLAEIAEGVANQTTIHNMALRQLEALLVRVLSKDVAAPPASPAAGDSYIIPAGATGAWSGKENQIAAFIGGAWSYFTVGEGVRLWINDLNVEYVFDGAAWAPNGGDTSDFLTQADADAAYEQSGAAAAAVSAHEAASNPHPEYLTQAEADLLYASTAAATGGTVTSVELTAPGALFDVAGSPVTTSGALAMSLKTQVKNTFLAGPATGADAAPTMRALTAADLPAQPFDIHTFYPGVPTASAKLYRGKLARAVTFPVNFAGAQFTASVNATGSTVFDIQKNGASVGSCTIAAGSATATFVSVGGSAVSFAAGDVFSVIAPATADATLADPAITFAGTR